MRRRVPVVLTGARQSGKTSLVRRLFPVHHYVSLDLPSEAAQAEGDPVSFLARNPPPLIVDECQYAPGLMRHLKREIDAHRHLNGRFILTGSQPFELMAGVTESLAGRAAILTLGGLSYSEVLASGAAFSVEEFLPTAFSIIASCPQQRRDCIAQQAAPRNHGRGMGRANGHQSQKCLLDDIHPLGYCPEGDVIADASVFLISDKARFITGHIMHVAFHRPHEWTPARLVE